MDSVGWIGVIILVGVVVNNGIVLIDYVNRLRGRGMKRLEAIRVAAERRFRPIMMTAITTIGGMVPLALAGANSIGLSYTSFSLTPIGYLAATPSQGSASSCFMPRLMRWVSGLILMI